ncbi:hypothetical protein Leryth_014923, partial [Lithospermum erythrorhizon]
MRTNITMERKPMRSNVLERDAILFQTKGVINFLV